MAVKTHLGPQLLGTVKNSSAPSFPISASQLGQYRNLGATVCFQYALGAACAGAGQAATGSVLQPALNITDLVQATGTTTNSGSTITLTPACTPLASQIYPGMIVVGFGLTGNYAASTSTSSGGCLVTGVSGNVITMATINSVAPVGVATGTTTTFSFYDPSSPANTSPVVIPAGAIIIGFMHDPLIIGISSPTTSIGLISNSTVSNAQFTIFGAANTATTRAFLTGYAASAATGLVYSQLWSAGQGGLNPSDSILGVKYTATAVPTIGLSSVGIMYVMCNPDGTVGQETPGYGSATY